MNIVTKIRVNSWSNSLYALIPLWICPFSSTNVEDSLQINLFLQNKPKVKNAKIIVSSFITSIYVKVDNWLNRKNKPNSKPFKPNFRKDKMNVNLYIIEDYIKRDDFADQKNKPNSRKAQNERKHLYKKVL